MDVLSQTQTAFAGASSGAIIDNRFYVLCSSGRDPSRLDTIRTLPVDGSEQILAEYSVPTPRGNVVVVAAGARVFTIAGILGKLDRDKSHDGPSTTVESLDTRTGQWSKCAPLPAQRVKPGVAVVGDFLYALGGREDEIDAATIFAYDLTNDSWNEVGELPYAARHGAACAHQGMIYYCGGFTAAQKTFHDLLLVFDPNRGTMEPLAAMPVPRTAHALVAGNNALYALGGVDTEKQPTTTVFRYDISENRWTDLAPLASERAVFACDILGNNILLAGGWKRMGQRANSTTEIYTV